MIRAKTSVFMTYKNLKFNKEPSEAKEITTKMHLREDWHVKFFAFQLFLFSSQNINNV